MPERRDWMAGAAAGLIAFAVYLLTLAPTLTWAHDGTDGGDLITAVLTGGVPHPPGYPAYLLLGSLFVHLPFGDAAYRLNLMSAFCGAVAVAITAWTTIRLTDNRWAWPAGLVAGLALAFSPILWSQAVIAEVYAPAGLFVALALWITLGNGDSWQRWAILGGVWGAGLGMHLTLLLLAPIVGAAWLRTPRAETRRWPPRGPALLAGMAIGLIPFAWIPFRAQTGAPIRWGEPTTVRSWWWLVSGELYRPYVFALPLSELPARLGAWAALSTRQFTPVGTLLAIGGGERLWRRDRNLTVALIGSALAFSAYAIGYNTTDSYVYLLPAVALLAPLLGLGLERVLVWLETQWNALSRNQLLCWGMVLLLPAAALILGWPNADLTNDRAAHDFGATLLEQAPAHALLLSSQDGYTFALWYFHYGLQWRPDVAVIDPGLWGFGWYRRQLAQSEGIDDASNLQSALAATGRPVCDVQAERRLDCR